MAQLIRRRSMAHRTVMLERFRLSLALQEIGPRPSVAAGSMPFTGTAGIATVFSGTALLLLAMLFAVAAMTDAAMLLVPAAKPNELNSVTFRLARAAFSILPNLSATKMAAVFMISTSTVVIYTGITGRWIAASMGLADRCLFPDRQTTFAPEKFDTISKRRVDLCQRCRL